MGRCCFFTTVTLASLCLTVAVVMLAGVYDVIFDAILDGQMALTTKSMSYEIWKDTPVPMAISFYLYNITNPVEFEDGEKAVLHELGPYVYKEFHRKTGVDFQRNHTVTFYQQRWWIWDQEASGDNKEEDVVCLLNTVPVSAAYAVRDHAGLLAGLGATMFGIGEELTLFKTAREILFDGYEDPLLDLVHNVTDGEDPLLPELIEILPSGLLDYDRMGWFYKRNNSEEYDGYFGMFTGTDDLQMLGNIDTWNGERTTNFFTPPCNKVTGSAGELWPPEQSDTNITFYSSDLCMSLTLPFSGHVTDEFGLEGYRYAPNIKTFANPSLVPENHCYCFQNLTENCPPSGLLDAQTCRMGAPAYISFPHYLHGDSALFDEVEGLQLPDLEKHQFHLDMIPELGVPIKVNARMQINIQVTRYRTVPLLSGVRDAKVPVIWFEVTAGLTSELASELSFVLFLMRTPTMTIIWSVLIALAVTILSNAATYSFVKRRREDQQPLIDSQVI